MDAYKDATKELYGYLLIDLSAETDENYRNCTNIFPDDLYVRVHLKLVEGTRSVEVKTVDNITSFPTIST